MEIEVSWQTVVDWVNLSSDWATESSRRRRWRRSTEGERITIDPSKMVWGKLANRAERGDRGEGLATPTKRVHDQRNPTVEACGGKGRGRATSRVGKRAGRTRTTRSYLYVYTPIFSLSPLFTIPSSPFCFLQTFLYPLALFFLRFSLFSVLFWLPFSFPLSMHWFNILFDFRLPYLWYQFKKKSYPIVQVHRSRNYRRNLRVKQVKTFFANESTKRESVHNI